MPKIHCGADWCDKNEKGLCTNDEIELTYDPYEQFWCESAWQYGMKNTEFNKLPLKKQMEVIKNAKRI